MENKDKSGPYSKDVAASGLSWGFELESIVLGIMGDAKEMAERPLLDLLMNQSELKPLFKTWSEHPIKKPDGGFRTVRDELEYLLNDITNGNWHAAWEDSHGEHRKLSKWKVKNGDTEYTVIRPVKNESGALKK